MTPIMPEITGAPPTQATAKGRSSPPNQGSSRKAKMTDSPLNMPKYKPKVIQMRI